MWRPTPEVEAFELPWLRDYPLDLPRTMRLVEALYEHAHKLGAFRRRDPGDGLEARLRLEDKIRFARALNGLRSPDGDRQGLR